jgi:large subunit ribosomal protein L13
MQKTFSEKPQNVEKTWWLVDAKGQTLGRLATVVANLLRGKHKPSYTPHIDSGDFVIVVNAEHIQVTGKKFKTKLYRHHTGNPRGFRQFTFEQMMDRHPERILEKAIFGMLPHNRLGRRQYTKLKVYTGAEHQHGAQQPKIYEFKEAN